MSKRALYGSGAAVVASATAALTLNSTQNECSFPKLVRIATDKAPKAIGPYSQGIKTGGFLFTSGQIAMKASNGELVPGGIIAETNLALHNLTQVLEQAGCSPKDVVKTTVFLENMDDFKAMNFVYEQYFGDHKPARSTVQVAKLPKGAKVEIEAIARLKTHDVE